MNEKKYEVSSVSGWNCSDEMLIPMDCPMHRKEKDGSYFPIMIILRIQKVLNQISKGQLHIL